MGKRINILIIGLLLILSLVANTMPIWGTEEVLEGIAESSSFVAITAESDITDSSEPAEEAMEQGEILAETESKPELFEEQEMPTDISDMDTEDNTGLKEEPPSEETLEYTEVGNSCEEPQGDEDLEAEFSNATEDIFWNDEPASEEEPTFQEEATESHLPKTQETAEEEHSTVVLMESMRETAETVTETIPLFEELPMSVSEEEQMEHAIADEDDLVVLSVDAVVAKTDTMQPADKKAEQSAITDQKNVKTTSVAKETTSKEKNKTQSKTAKNGFTKSGSKWKFYKDGKIQKVTGLIKGTINGKTGWYYIKNGVYKPNYTGVAKRADGKTESSYYVQSGQRVKKSGFQNLKGKTWYFSKNGTVKKATGIIKGTINGKTGWYYIKNGVYKSYNGIAKKVSGNTTKTYAVKNGKLTKVTGWKTVAGKKYYFNNSKTATTGKKNINGLLYYFDTQGVQKTGFTTIDDTLYYFSPAGTTAGWYVIKGKTYYVLQTGVVKTGWFKDSRNRQFYFDQNGVMLTGTQTIGGKEYQFTQDGELKKTVEPKKDKTEEPEKTIKQNEDAPKTEETVDPKQPFKPQEEPQISTPQTEEEKPHTHTWKPVYKTIHHDAITHEEPVYEYVYYPEKIEQGEFLGYKSIRIGIVICSCCGEEFASDDEWYVHSAYWLKEYANNHYSMEGLKCNGGGYRTGYKTIKDYTQPVYASVYTPSHTEYELTGYRTVIDVPAFDEQVVDHYECNECHACK